MRFRHQHANPGSPDRRRLPALIVAAAAATGLALFAGETSALAEDAHINPLADYAEWNVVAFGDVHLSAESEGPVAAAGAFSFLNSNVALHTATASSKIGLLAGKIDLASSTGTLRVLSGGEVRIEDFSDVSAVGTDSNNAVVATRVIAAGAVYDSTPAVAVGHHQAPQSVPARGLFASMFSHTAAVSTSTTVADASMAGSNQARRVTASMNGSTMTLTLAPGDNYWNVSAEELSQIRNLTFEGVAVSPANPLIVNVTGAGPLTLQLTMAGARDPSGILFNAVDVTTITQSGDSIDGSILAPRATYTKTSANLQGALIVANAHLAGSEEHFFPFRGFITPPTKPAEPTKPTEPTEPTEPTVPTEPTEPGEPTEPSEPAVPAAPVQTLGAAGVDPVSRPANATLASTGPESTGSLWLAAGLLAAGATLIATMVRGRKGAAQKRVRVIRG